MISPTKEYLLLFNAITDAETELRALYRKLIAIQRQAEELYLNEEDETEIQE